MRAVVSVATVGTEASLMTGAVASAPRAIAPPRIVGAPRVGWRLTATRGRWDGWALDFATTWYRCHGTCDAVANGGTYRPRPRDRGYRLRVEVVASNALGTVAVRSRSTAKVR
jgi:hypothetical protein